MLLGVLNYNLHHDNHSIITAIKTSINKGAVINIRQIKKGGNKRRERSVQKENHHRHADDAGHYPITTILLPFPFSTLLYLIISIFVLAKFWSRSKRPITLLLLAILGINFAVAFLMPFPFSLLPSFAIGYFVIDAWLNRKKRNGNQQ